MGSACPCQNVSPSSARDVRSSVKVRVDSIPVTSWDFGCAELTRHGQHATEESIGKYTHSPILICLVFGHAFLSSVERSQATMTIPELLQYRSTVTPATCWTRTSSNPSLRTSCTVRNRTKRLVTRQSVASCKKDAAVQRGGAIGNLLSTKSPNLAYSGNGMDDK